MRSATLVASVLVLAACGRSGPGVRSAEMGSFHVVGVGARVDPTLRPARLLPEAVDETTTYGSEAGGGTRAITAGLRVVTSPKGAILAAENRLPQPPIATTALPERLGGGFLFVVGSTLWRADRWLGPAKPIFTAAQTVTAITPGLDRVYVRSQHIVMAIDGKTGRVLDLGAWPASPYVASYAAADGWRAAAVTDLRGVVATFDAGATWRALDLPFDPKQVIASGDNLAIGGLDTGGGGGGGGGGARSESWYELRPDGSLSRLGAPPREAKTKLAAASVSASRGVHGGIVLMPVPATAPSAEPPRADRRDADESRGAGEDQDDFVAKTFGKRPLAAAIEDGWPLTDGTAVIARDGALARVRLDDGMLTELVRDAFPLKPARCHPVSLTRPAAAGAFGFVCGEPRGATVIYAYEPLRGRLAEIKRFDKPRVVTSSGNGALAVRGACAEDAETPAPPAPERVRLNDGDELDKDHEGSGSAKDKTKSKTGDPDAPPAPSAKPAHPPPRGAASATAAPAPPVAEVHPYCVLGHDNVWREVHVRGDVGGERVVVLADGRIVVLSPPQGYDSPPRITILDKGHATTLPVQFPRVTNDVARVLRFGLWLDGFEERRPGVVAGWLEAGGTMLGLEIGLDGRGTPGQFIRDAGAPFVSGKYGLGWTASRRGYETTDGGMTWTNIEVPDPLVPMAKVERRACGPIGCLAGGWLRVGWGEAKRDPAPAPPAAYRSTTTPIVPLIQLACEPTGPLPPAAPQSHSGAAANGRAGGHVDLGQSIVLRSHFSSSGPPVLQTYQGLTELQAFYNQAAPVVREPDRGVTAEVKDLIEKYPNVGPLARIYGWGPKTGDWDTLGRWQVKWLSPFAGWPEIHTSLPAAPPQILLDQARQPGYGSFGGMYVGSYGGSSQNASYQLAAGDDPSHALLVGRRPLHNDPVLFELDADRAPVEIHRADGEPFAEIEGAVRATGRWFVSTPATSANAGMMPLVTGSASFSIVWQIEGAVARELVRVPRTLADGPNSTLARTRLARRSDGRAIGLVVDGAPTIDRPTNVRWALPIDLETGALGEPESIGYTDLAGRTVEGCTDDIVGWVLDTAIPGSVVRVRLPQGSGAIASAQARLRLTSERACIERIAGTYDGQSPDRAAQLTRAGAPATRTGPLRPGEFIATAMNSGTRFALKCSIGK